ncbi:MAG: RNA 2'-phosphotransferase [Candidatus Helarchaeota archaeon]
MSKKTIDKKYKVKISKYMSYILRHNPKQLELDEKGYTNLEDFLNLVQSRFKSYDKKEIFEIAEENERYEIAANKIRAIYGHSIDIKYKLEQAVIEKLYHGTTKKAADKILKEGLKPMNRQKVHLSIDVPAATRVGKRKTPNPTILIIEAGTAIKEGIVIEKASEKVYLSDFIPPKFIKILKN